MTVLRLRADTEEAMIAAVPDEWRGPINEAGDIGWRTKGPTWDIKVLGEVAIANAVFDDTDPDNPIMVTPPVIDTRFHMDVLLTGVVPEGIPQKVICHPKTPRHSFQGIDA